MKVITILQVFIYLTFTAALFADEIGEMDLGVFEGWWASSASPNFHRKSKVDCTHFPVCTSECEPHPAADTKITFVSMTKDGLAEGTFQMLSGSTEKRRVRFQFGKDFNSFMGTYGTGESFTNGGTWFGEKAQN